MYGFILHFRFDHQFRVILNRVTRILTVLKVILNRVTSILVSGKHFFQTSDHLILPILRLFLFKAISDHFLTSARFEQYFDDQYATSTLLVKKDL